jgi:hypothetical protein
MNGLHMSAAYVKGGVSWCGLHVNVVNYLVTSLQEVCTQLKRLFNCAPMFIAPEVKEKYYKGKHA